MQLRKLLLFLFQFVTIGLAAAFVVIFLKPDILEMKRPVVEIRQSAPASSVENNRPGVKGLSEPFSYSSAVKLAAPAVVSVFSAKLVKQENSTEELIRRFYGIPMETEPRIETSLGSGVIMTDQGHIITNHHVIAGSSEIQVMLSDGRIAKAKIVGADPETDLAVLQIPLQKLPSITIGNSDKLEVGDVVLAIGNPFGVGQTVTQGIVSATGRKRLGLNTFENFIQTDAAINPGNSGGSLINPRGELIGINSAIFSKSGGSQGIGFAIPVNLARDVMTQIIEKGHVVRGWLGIRMSNVPPKLAEQLGFELATGVIITDIFEGSPALAAGMRPGDIITAINGQKIYDIRSILDMVSRQPPGTKITLEGIRERKPFKLDVKVAERPTATIGGLRK